jgi:hypothetical protein
MKDFLAYPASRVLSFRPLSVHPVPYLRIFIQVEMVRRMGFTQHAQRMQNIWASLYARHVPRGRVPPALIATATRIIPHVVDEIAYQPRRNLGQRALVDVVPFAAADEQAIHRAASMIGRGTLPPQLPPRFAVSASRYAFERRMGTPQGISRTVLMGLATREPEPGVRRRATNTRAVA